MATAGIQRQPILVTGAPRSGTTWGARVLSTARNTAMPGREPMNPHTGQYGLANTLSGWACLRDLTPRQEAALRRCFKGVEPRLFGRYGKRQWAAPLPHTRVVIKDPFAMLSLQAIHRVTNAAIVLMYRHPAAVYQSYRRVGWEPDLAEVRTQLRAFPADLLPSDLPLATDPCVDRATLPQRVALFWNSLYAMALAEVSQVGLVHVVCHEELAEGGPLAAAKLLDRLGLEPTARTRSTFQSARGGSAESDSRLHHLDRQPAEVATSWRGSLSERDLVSIEDLTSPVRERLDRLRLSLRSPGESV